MKLTIKAKTGYKVCKHHLPIYSEVQCGLTIHTVFDNSRVLVDGNEPVMIAYVISIKDRDEEIRGNEAFCFQERFETAKAIGNIGVTKKPITITL